MGSLAAAMGAVLVKLAVAVLAYYHGRADYKSLIMSEVRNAGLQLALEAEKFKAAARVSGARPGFGVRGGAGVKPKRVQAKDAGSDD